MYFGYYTPILILQGYCLYHAYSRNEGQKWFFLIIFIPLFGSLFYLYQQFYSKKGVENIAEGMKEIFITNHRVEQFEKEVKAADTVVNKIKLADEYLLLKRYEDAIETYLSCFAGFNDDDSKINRSLVTAYYLHGDYANAIRYGNHVKTDINFLNSEERVAYAWSFYRDGKKDEAIEIFSDMNKKFSNYVQRIEYFKFLNEIEKADEAKILLEEMKEEFELMGKNEKTDKREIFNAIENLQNEAE